ncbi:MAG: hypothetical protein V4719_24530 [Planctomycetota bacterium]
MPAGRGSEWNPPNRFQVPQAELAPEHLEFDDDFWAEQANLKTEFRVDSSKSVISQHNSLTV